MGQDGVYQFETTTLQVEQEPGDTYTWEFYRDSTVNFATTPGDATSAEISFPGGNTGASIDVNWLDYGVFFYKVTSVNATSCTNNLKIGRIEILQGLPTATLSADSICTGDIGVLNVKLTGLAPWSITYTNGTSTETINDINDSAYQITIDPGPKTTTEYWITEVTDSRTTNTEESEHIILEVHPKPNSSRIYQHNKIITRIEH